MGERRARSRLYGRRIVGVVGVVALAGCAPKIYSFDVAPRNLCAGGSATVHWRVRGRPALRLEIDDPRLPSGASADGGDRSAPDVITLTLVATRGSRHVRAQRDVAQFPDPFERPIVFATRRADDALVASGEIRPTSWDAHFVLAGVASASQRALRVTHAGRSVELRGDGTLSHALDATPLAGAWEIRWPLPPAGRATSAPLPDRLRLRAVVHCTP